MFVLSFFATKKQIEFSNFFHIGFGSEVNFYINLLNKILTLCLHIGIF